MRLKFTITVLLGLLLLWSESVSAQQVTVPSGSSTNDTIRTIEIIRTQRLRQKTLDSNTVVETAAGDVMIREGLTTTTCDSAVYNHRTNIIEAFGNVHINDNDSIHTYGQYLKYVGIDRIAYLKNNVRLTDKKGTLYTDDLEYNLRTGIATYRNGGRVVNGETVLTSRDGVYYADTKDIYFKKNVHFKDSRTDIVTDSLLYNMNTGIATFIAPTHIVSKDGSIIDTKSGTYNLKTGEAVFYDRTTYRDKSISATGDEMAYDKKSGILQIRGRGKLVDSVNRAIVIGDEIYANRDAGTFLATKKPVMILYRDGDSTYIAADTLFSGLSKYDSLEKKSVAMTDTVKTAVAVKANKDTAIRYFLAFHHVRIFNDSLQAVSDSLHYSAADSTFKLFKDPVVWNNNTQVKGDTIYMYTERQQPKRLYVFYNSIVINKTSDGLFNQIAGRTLNGYFKEGNIDYIRVKGSPAESVFYPQDDDSAYVGMNRSSGDVIDMYFVKKELNKVKFINDVNGTMYPIRQVPPDQKELKNFKWLDNRRPKNKLELFE